MRQVAASTVLVGLFASLFAPLIILANDEIPACGDPSGRETAMIASSPPPSAVGGALLGRSLTLVPGHGYFWNGTNWVQGRGIYCAPLSAEDDHNLEICQFLEAYLVADGMIVKPSRCTNKQYGVHSAGFAWWRMGSNSWLEHMGYPCSVYAPYTHDCVIGAGASESADDAWAGAFASNHDNTDLLIALHTNGARGNCTGDCPTGSEIYYCTSGIHEPWGEVSLALAQHVNTGVLDSVVAHADPTWICHGVCVKHGCGADVYFANRPAMMIELAFHDTCDRDADEYHLRDNFFRSAAMWGIYKGVCDFFGTQPTWPPYWAEYVGDTIPSVMNGGQTYNVSVTLRNRGIAWTGPRGFYLAAVGGSDPLAPAAQYAVGWPDVGPGQEATFHFTMTPPWAGGVFLTQWQMMRQGASFFGDAASREVTVIPFAPPDFDRDGDVDQVDFGHLQSCYTGNTQPQLSPECQNARLDGDNDVDQGDFLLMLGCMTGAGEQADPLCTE